jgi:hypothetical protein
MSGEMEEAQETACAESKVTAKSISKIFKFVSGLGLIASLFLYWLGWLPNATTREICFGWFVVYALGAGTIDVNLILEKFFGAKQ